MKTTPKERTEIVVRLLGLGVSFEDANKLRRISMTLGNWFELECGTGDDRVTRSIERDENGEGRPWLRVQYRGTNGQWQDRRYPAADREKGARKRLAAVMARYADLVPYVQGDPRGASLYVLRKADVNGHEIDSVYTRGVAVY